jgi:hypothetical protein
LACETARRNFAEAVAKVTVRVNEVRFLNRTEAAVAYDIVIPNYSPVPEVPDGKDARSRRLRVEGCPRDHLHGSATRRRVLLEPA